MESQPPQTLSDDMLLEIASRSSPEALASLRASSKTLNLATHAPTFALHHSVSGFVFQTLEENEDVVRFIAADGASQLRPVSLDFLPLKVNVNATSDELGLVYCESREGQSRFNGSQVNNNLFRADVNNHYLCKGTTREWMQIPNPRTKGSSGLGGSSGIIVTNSNPLRYKIIRLHNDVLDGKKIQSDTKPCTSQIFYSDKPFKWWKLEMGFQLRSNDFEWIRPDEPMVTVNGNLHLLVGKKRVLVFDSLTDNWDFFATPESYQRDESWGDPKLMKYQGKLSLIDERNNQKSLILWILEDYKNKVWTRKCELSTQAVHSIDTYPFPSLYSFCNSDVGLFLTRFNAIFYNFKDHTVVRTEPLGKIKLRSFFKLQSDYKKMGWRTDEDAKGYRERQRAREMARHN